MDKGHENTQSVHNIGQSSIGPKSHDKRELKPGTSRLKSDHVTIEPSGRTKIAIPLCLNVKLHYNGSDHLPQTSSV